MIIMDADVYDAIHLYSLAFGGIGAYSDTALVIEGGKVGARDCNCVHGFFSPAEGLGAGAYVGINEYLINLGIGRVQNDNAVATVVKRNTGRFPGLGVDKITFEEWCAELNIVRGE